jgi:hypothetical protein
VIDGRHPPAWLNDLAWACIVISIVSAVIVGGDILSGRRQKMPIMNVVWPVTGLYFGPFALWAYWKYGRNNPQEKPFWAKVLVGDSHCGAGCTIGDIAGEWFIFLTGITIAGSGLWADYAADFTLAYLVGIVFQYFAIAPMRHISGWPGIKAAIKADTVALVSFEIGMFAWMAFASEVLFQPKPEPPQMVYWFSMQIAMVIGFATAFPANWWLIRMGFKEAM